MQIFSNKSQKNNRIVEIQTEWITMPAMQILEMPFANANNNNNNKKATTTTIAHQPEINMHLFFCAVQECFFTCYHSYVWRLERESLTTQWVCMITIYKLNSQCDAFKYIHYKNQSEVEFLLIRYESNDEEKEYQMHYN